MDFFFVFSLVFHYASDVGKLSPASTQDLHISRAEEILNKESGWKALAGTTNFGAIADSDDPACKLAFDLFVDRICAYIGSYFVSLGGNIDALVFAGGIGERSQTLRTRVIELVGCLGFKIDVTLNTHVPENNVVVYDVGAKDARFRTLVCRTDEQLELGTICAQDESLWK
jgi:acetate kinase